jgi:iron-sulfur cluster repair protein YtfE (RIC family)
VEGVRRSEALAVLSREHHQALFVALRLRRADAGSAAAERARFLAFWAAEGEEHFRSEEELLFPAYAREGHARHPLLERALGDHVAIRAQAARLSAVVEVDPEVLHELGTALAAHVRLEERELFPAIEEALGADELLSLARELARPADPGVPGAGD